MSIHFRKIIKPLASLKMAVIVISLIAIIASVGTIVESRYDAQAAQKLVYQSIWMMLTMGLLCITLIAVIIERYPWKPRHLAFIFAHVGILLLIAGQYISNNYGLDGSLRVPVGESNRFVVIPSKTDLTVRSSFDGSSYTKLYDREVDFFLEPPTADKPVTIPVDQEAIKVTDYKRYVVPTMKVVETDQSRAGAGLRFQIHNDRVNVVEWLVQRNPSLTASHDFGPAQIHLGPIPSQGRGKNEIYIEPTRGSLTLKYAVYKKDSVQPTVQGQIEEAGTVNTGWMGLELKVLRFYPKALQTWELTSKDRPSPLTTSAAQVEFQGQKHWVLLNDTLKLFTERAVYILTYANRMIDIGFPIKLDHFEVDRYQGTQRAASYKSQVEVPDLGRAEISMNEPLKYKGLTIYQASFDDGEKGPTASIFSINNDPGRWLKYMGSLIMTLGIVFLFFFRKQFQALGKKDKGDSL